MVAFGQAYAELAVKIVPPAANGLVFEQSTKVQTAGRDRLHVLQRRDLRRRRGIRELGGWDADGAVAIDSPAVNRFFFRQRAGKIIATGELNGLKVSKNRDGFDFVAVNRFAVTKAALLGISPTHDIAVAEKCATVLRAKCKLCGCAGEQIDFVKMCGGWGYMSGAWLVVGMMFAPAEDIFVESDQARLLVCCENVRDGVFRVVKWKRNLLRTLADGCQVAVAETQLTAGMASPAFNLAVREQRARVLVSKGQYRLANALAVFTVMIGGAHRLAGFGGFASIVWIVGVVDAGIARIGKAGVTNTFVVGVVRAIIKILVAADEA